MKKLMGTGKLSTAALVAATLAMSGLRLPAQTAGAGSAPTSAPASTTQPGTAQASPGASTGGAATGGGATGGTTPSTPQSTPGQVPSDPTATPSTSAGANSGADAAQQQMPSADTASAPDATLSGKPNKKVKKGSTEDVEAVGDRNPGHRGLGNWYSTESEIKMGKQYAMDVEKSSKIIADPVVTEYVNRIGQNLVRNSDAKVPFTIKVIDSDEINAFALPGGFFYVNSGLILAADEEAELAGVMAHEIAHVAAHHQARELTRMNYAQIGMIPMMIMLPATMAGYGIYEGSQLAIPLAFLHFDRTFEGQADYLGLQYMYHAGYDPLAFTGFFEKIQALEKQKPGVISKTFSTHPPTPERIAAAQKEINDILPAKAEYVVTTSEFDDVKARLARIENKRKMNDKSNGKKPTLRRASAGGAGDPGTPGDSGDDRPTLHRRDNN